MKAMAPATNRAVFNASLLPEAQPRWELFSASFGLQIFAVALLVIIPMLMPQKLEFVQHYWTTPVEAPPVVAWKPQPVQRKSRNLLRCRRRWQWKYRNQEYIRP